MQLTKQTDYAFRVLIYLAEAERNGTPIVRIPQISQYYEISQNHIAKIVANLSRQGWVASSRGKGGGVSLGMHASEIKLVDVVRVFEPSLKPVNCKEPVCKIAVSCRLRGLFDNAIQAFMNALEGYSLEDVSFGSDDIVRFIE